MCRVICRLAVVCAVLGVPLSAVARDVHVATEGDAANPGTKEQPLASILQAVEALRGAGPGTIWVEPGELVSFQRQILTMTSPGEREPQMRSVSSTPLRRDLDGDFLNRGTKIMNRFATVFFATALTIASQVSVAADTSVVGSDSRLDRCNVTWISPSRDSSGSMPLGNGDIGLNLWVEPDGDLLCYLSKTDAWCGTGRLLKLGRLRVSLDPNPFRAGLPFRQTLRLRDGEIEIVAGAEGQAVTLRIWVDACAPSCMSRPRGRTPWPCR